ncbi:MAG: pyridoxamine 5'-phosphate oxidase [Gammaproteobacteria bacterium]
MNFDSISQEPFLEIKYFLEQARDKKLQDWNGMTVSTVDEDQRPSSRVVLLKKFTDDGLFFYTNYKSKKGQDISKNNNVSVNFWWRELQVQIRISGTISEAPRQESEEYFNSRPKGSRISAIVSKQSEEIDSFESFQKKVEEAINSLEEKEIKLPDHCGMYKIIPNQIEIWKEGEFRRHERTLFKLEGKKWLKSYLSP